MAQTHNQLTREREARSADRAGIKAWTDDHTVTVAEALVYGVLQANKASAMTLTFPTPEDALDGIVRVVQNLGAGAASVTMTSPSGSITRVLAQGDLLVVACDGSYWYAVSETMLDIHNVVAGAVPDVADKLVYADESATGDPTLACTVAQLFAAYPLKWRINLGTGGEDTDGAGTNGGGVLGGSGVDIATNIYNDGAGNVAVKVYDAGDDAWDDLSDASALTGWTADYQLLPDANAEAEGDAFAIGLATPFCEVCFNDLATNNGTLATYGGDCGKWQYSTDQDTWSDLTVFDNTDSTAQDGKRPLQRTGTISFAPPADWATAEYDDSGALYWIQWVVTGAQLTQTPLIDDTNKDEPMVVLPNADAPEAPCDGSITRLRVVNPNGTVHNQAIKFCLWNATQMTFTAQLTWAASQQVDSFDLSSAPLAVSTGDLIAVIIQDDAAAGANPQFDIELDVTPA